MSDIARLKTPVEPENISESLRLPRRCWVCQQEDTDDTPGNDVWRTPCPCSLTAHDTCLLEWISNEEAPRPGDIARSRLIRCPQCRAEIKIQRPRDYLVIVFEAIQRITNAMVLPGAAASLIMCTYAGLLVYGMNTIKIVFGNEDALKIMKASTIQTENIWGTTRILANIIKQFDPLLPSTYPLDFLKVFIGTPLIAPSLIILRTRWAHRAFSFLLPLHFMNPANQKISWPPPPGLVFATLPYLKTAYNELHRYLFGRLESNWDMAVQRKPRAGETREEIAFEAEREDTEGFLEIRLALTEENDVRIPEQGGNLPTDVGRAQQLHQLNLPRVQIPIENIQEQAERLNNNEVANARNEGSNSLPLPNDSQNNDNEDGPNLVQLEEPDFVVPRRNDHHANAERNAGRNIPPNDDRTVVHHYHASQLISLVIGALSFPTVAALAGDILKYTLPSSLVTPQLTYSWGIRSFKRGILTEKWGRTVVGGCLFVLLRDAVILYCKWKKAREFGKRVVVDYVKPRINSR
ncbi:hypothetical protein HI914_05791 [Erysiphe necator]|nr:hypothetical protein HI914_05791 [Erysiphe necator]